MTQAFDLQHYSTPSIHVRRAVLEPPPSVYQELRDASRVLGLSTKAEHFEESVARLKKVGLLALDAILDEVAACPREEVLHDAAEIIAQISAQSGFFSTLERIQRTAHPVQRALIARALGYVVGFDDERLTLLVRALSDPEAEVRDRAAMALGHLSDARAVSALEAALQAETVGFIRESILDTLTALRH